MSHRIVSYRIAKQSKAHHNTVTMEAPKVYCFQDNESSNYDGSGQETSPPSASLTRLVVGIKWMFTEEDGQGFAGIENYTMADLATVYDEDTYITQPGGWCEQASEGGEQTGLMPGYALKQITVWRGTDDCRKVMKAETVWGWVWQEGDASAGPDAAHPDIVTLTDNGSGEYGVTKNVFGGVNDTSFVNQMSYAWSCDGIKNKYTYQKGFGGFSDVKFVDLKEFVDFYNTNDVAKQCCNTDTPNEVMCTAFGYRNADGTVNSDMCENNNAPSAARFGGGRTERSAPRVHPNPFYNKAAASSSSARCTASSAQHKPHSSCASSKSHKPTKSANAIKAIDTCTSKIPGECALKTLGGLEYSCNCTSDCSCKTKRGGIHAPPCFWDRFGVWIVLVAILFLGGAGWVCYKYYEKNYKQNTQKTPTSVTNTATPSLVGGNSNPSKPSSSNPPMNPAISGTGDNRFSRPFNNTR